MTAPLPNGSSAALPAPILRALRAFIRRARGLIVLRGACATAAVTAASFLLVMLIDAGVTLFAVWPRWLLTVAAYSASGTTAVWFIIRPLARSFTLAGAARLIEAHHPELQERISSAVELLASRDLPALRGSDVLIAALTEEAILDAGGVQPRREISFRAAVPFVAGALVGAGILGGLFALRPMQTRFLFARAAAPFLNLPNIYATELAVTPGDVYVAQGSRFTVSVTTSNRAIRQAFLLRTAPNGGEEVTDMVAIPTTNAACSLFAYTIPTVACSFRYRIHAGDALTRFYRADVAVPPTLQRVRVHYRFPPYAGLTDVDDKDALGAVRALVGTEVTLSAQANKPCVAALLTIMASGAPPPIPGVLRKEGETTFYDFRLTMPPRLAGIWTIRLVDSIGLTNAPFERTIQAIADRPPVVRAPELAQSELRLNHDELLPVVYVAEDDIGLREVNLRLSVDGRDLPDRPLPLPVTNAPVRLVRDRTVLDLSDRDFSAAHQVRFSFLARDGLPGPMNGPQSGTSSVYTILLDAQASSWIEQSLDSQRKALKLGLEQTRDMLKSAVDAEKSVSVALAKPAPLPSETVKTLDRIQERLGNAQANLRDAGEQLRSGYFPKMAERAETVADEQIGRAENLAGQVKLADTPAERNQLAADTTKQAETAEANVEQMIKTLDPLADALKQAVELDRMATRQTDLARDRTAMDKVPPAALTNTASELPTPDEWKAAEKRMGDNLAKLAREMPQATNAFAEWRNETAGEAALEATALGVSQSNLAEAVKQQMTALQSIDKTLAGLADRQDKLAETARTNPKTAPEAERMAKAAEAIRADALPEARTDQTAAEQALQQTAAALRQDVPPPGGVQPEEAPKVAAAQAAQHAREALDEAKQSARQADQAAAQAAARAADAAKLEQHPTAKEDRPAQADLKEAAEAARKNAKEAADWDQAAKQSVDQTREAAQQAQEAAAQAAKAPNAAEAEKARVRAEDAAQRAEHAADNAQAFAEEAVLKNAEAGVPQKRAIEAAKEAEGEARQAEEAAQVAHEAADRAQNRSEQTRRDALLPHQAKPEEQQAANARAKQAEDQAKLAANAATEAHQAADTAEKAAHAAQDDAQATAKEKSPKAAQDEMGKAEEAAAEAKAAARQATQLAHQAIEAAREPGQPQPPSQTPAAAAVPTPADAKQAEALEARQSADQAHGAAERAEHAAQAAQAAAEQTAQNAAQDQREADQAKGKPEAVTKLAEARQSEKLTNAARQAAAEARTAANAAQRASQEAGQQAQQAQAAGTEQQAEAARIRADQDAQAALDAAGEAAQAANAARGDARLAAAKQDAERVEQLAHEQGQVRAATEGLVAQRAQTVEALRHEQMAFLETEQGRLAAHADTLAKAVAAALPEEKAPADAASDRADKARDALTEGNLPQAAQAARAAGQELGQLSGQLRDAATRLNNQPTPTPSSDATPGQVAGMAEQATELAADQSRLASELSALASGRPIEALTSQQDFLASRVAALDGDVQRLREQTADVPLPGPSSASLGQAAEQTRRAQSATAEATTDMKQAAAAPSKSEAAARQAAQAQGQSAQQLGQAAQSLHQAETATAGAAAQPGQMVFPEALDDLHEAAQSQDAMPAIQAADALTQAAGKAQQQARALGGNPSPSGPRMSQTGGSGINPLEPIADERASLLQRFGLRLRDWLRLPGDLRDDVMQAAQTDGPEEYRPLIKRYFQEVSKQGGRE